MNVEPLPAIVLWPATRTRPSSPPPSPGNDVKPSEALPSTPPLRAGLNQRAEWIANVESPFFSRHNIGPMTPPLSPEEFTFKKALSGRSSPPRYPLTMGYDGGASSSQSANVPTGSPSFTTVEDGRRASFETLKENSLHFVRRMFPPSMLGITLDGAGTAEVEKRKIQSKDRRISLSSSTMKWRYKRVWRKRALLLILFLAVLYQAYKAVVGVDLASTPSSWLGGEDSSEPSSKYMRSTMKRTNPTGRAAAPTSQRQTRKQQRVQSVASSVHPVEKGVLAVDTSLPVTSHPILQLTQHARREWDDKVARQSKTLRDAVNEYKKRNRGMNPPKGFDKWWKLVK